MDTKSRYYDMSSSDVLKELGTSENGLSSAEAAERLSKYGPNKLAEAEKTSMIAKFIKSLADPMIIMLLVAALVQAVVTVIEAGGKPSIGDFTDVFVILLVVIINAIMSLVQENKAEAAMDALMVMTAAKAKVLRDGQMIFADSETLVVGDVLILEAGDSVAADCRILSAHSLKAEEAAMTGESLPVLKMVDALNCENTAAVPLGDRSNMLFSGSTVVYGRGTAVVVKTGMDTEMGKIAGALTTAEKEQTPLQKKMAELSGFLTKLVIGICLLVFTVGIIENVFLSSEPFSWSLLGNVSINTFVAAIALAVAAIPEGLPTVVTIVLSIGVTSMAKRKALVRKLTAVETLGCTQIICSDKTGTLTQNKMTVVETDTPNKELLAKAMALCSDSELPDGAAEAVGEPTENALVNFAASLNMRKPALSAAEPRVSEAPFDSERKMMSTIHKKGEGFIQYTKGACDQIVEKCTYYLDGESVRPMTEVKKAEILKANKQYADKALRVLTAAYKLYDVMPTSVEPADLEYDMIYIGLLGMIDPCRPEVYEAIRNCRAAGIRPIMITGDHIDTAVAIAKGLGIVKDASEAMVGAGLDKYTDEQLVEEVTKYSVYARVQPEHKSRIVRAWQARGCVTAMTGDGVNDAPSIKAADIGIGMGITGTDVTKGVADMVLADDNFATIVNAVEEGRKIYDNVCKVIQFQLSTNMAEVLIMFFASLFNFTILSPVHLLWVNMVTDSLPGLALGMEKAEGDVMKRKPRSSSEGIFSGGAGVDMVWQGIYLAVVALLSYFIGYRMANGNMDGLFGGPVCGMAVSMAFVTVNFTELFCAMNMRSRRKSLFAGEMLKRQNLYLWGAFAITTLLTVAAVFMPGVRSVFKMDTPGFGIREFMIAVGLAATVFPVFEIGKAVHRIARKEN